MLALGLLWLANSAQAMPVVCGSGDDTAAIQAALDSPSHYAELPEGTCKVSSLNATNRTAPTIRGKGKFVTDLQPLVAGKNVIDCTGSTHCMVADLRIDGMDNVSVEPATGILAAQMAGSASCDQVDLNNIRVDGFFSLAAVYGLSCASSHIEISEFYNYQPSGLTAIFTGNNFFGAHSDFVAIDNANDQYPSDWTFLATEFHNFNQVGNGAPSGGTGWAVWLGGVGSYHFFGGNFSSSAPIIAVEPVTISGGTRYPANVEFHGTTFYSDFPPSAACAVSGYPPAVSFSNVTNTMPLTGC